MVWESEEPVTVEGPRSRPPSAIGDLRPASVLFPHELPPDTGGGGQSWPQSVDYAWALGDSKRPGAEPLRFTTEELDAAGVDPAWFGLIV